MFQACLPNATKIQSLTSVMKTFQLCSTLSRDWKVHPRGGVHTRLKGNPSRPTDLAGGLVREAKIPDTGGHGCLPQWSGRGPEAAGSSCRALWQSVQAPWSCSRSCAGGAAGCRKGRLTGSQGGGAPPAQGKPKVHCKQEWKVILMTLFRKEKQDLSDLYLAQINFS